MLRVTPIYGSTGHHPSSQSVALPPTCTLIEYGGIRLLVNVGHDESYSNNALCDLPQADVVLLTDSSLQSLGGVPFHYGQDSGRKRLKKEKKRSDNKKDAAAAAVTRIYATYPTVKMGQMTLYDHHANVCLDGGDPGFSLQDIDSLFATSKYYQEAREYNASSSSTNQSSHNNENNKKKNSGVADDKNNEDGSSPLATIQTLKYAQTVVVNGPDSKPAISITPHKAGHLVGASYFILKRLVDETEVVVAPVYHHAKEKHLDSSTLYKYGTACDVLVTSCGGPGGLLGELYNPKPKSSRGITVKRKLNPPSVGRDEGLLLDSILFTLRNGGNVLLPADASGRVLELVLLLNQHWEKHRLGSTYNLCWVGSMVQNTNEFAKSQLEWMAKPLGVQFDGGRGHPYSLKNMQIFSSALELESEYPGLFGMNVDDIMDTDLKSNANPTCVIASGGSLDCGPARDIFLKWCQNEYNHIILTDSRRCVLRGDVLLGRRAKEHLLKNKVNSNRRISSDVSVVSDNESVATVTTGVSDQFGVDASMADTINIVQEDEEVAGAVAVNIGTAISTAELSEYSTAGQLLIKWCEAKAADVEMEEVVKCDVLVPRRSALAGSELQAFLAREEEKRRKEIAEEERLAMLREVELAKGRLRLNETEDTSASKSNEEKGSSSKSKHVSGDGKDNSSRPRKKNRFDANLFMKFSKPCHMTFEVREEAVGIGQPDSIAKYGIGESVGQGGDIVEDDYGISVKPEIFVDIVSGVDPSKFTSGKGPGRIGDDTLKRGLGFGSDGRPLLDSGGKMSSSNDTRNGELDMVGLEDEEMALEASDLSDGNGIIRSRNNRPPVKVSTEPRRIEVLAEIAFIPLEGRVDSRAARQSVRALQPRQVVILGGGCPMKENDNMTIDLDKNVSNNGSIIEGEASILADAVRSLSFGDKRSIFAPTDCETIELSVGHAAFSARLINTPYLSREEKGEMEEAGMELPPSQDLHEAKVGDCTVSLLDFIATGQRVAADGSIVLAPRRFPKLNQQQLQSAVMLSDRDVLLTDLRSEVIAQGMKADYSSHVGYAQLVVNGKIVVRKDQLTGEINVEGPLCEDFFSVRSVVCGQFVTL